MSAHSLALTSEVGHGEGRSEVGVLDEADQRLARILWGLLRKNAVTIIENYVGVRDLPQGQHYFAITLTRR